MCGRYTLTIDIARLAAEFRVAPPFPSWRPRYNIAPTQPVLIVREIAGLGRRLDEVRWGLVPPWTKDPDTGRRLINARAESVAERPAFRTAFRRRRCLIPADGFYEWQSADGHKRPYWVGLRDRRPFAFAGLWEHWQAAPDKPVVETCAIITTAANRAVATLHARMPAILTGAAADQWLDPVTPDPQRLLRLIGPYAGADEMLIYPVSRAVNNPQNDYEGLLAPAHAD